MFGRACCAVQFEEGKGHEPRGNAAAIRNRWFLGRLLRRLWSGGEEAGGALCSYRFSPSGGRVVHVRADCSDDAEWPQLDELSSSDAPGDSFAYQPSSDGGAGGDDSDDAAGRLGRLWGWVSALWRARRDGGADAEEEYGAGAYLKYMDEWRAPPPPASWVRERRRAFVRALSWTALLVGLPAAVVVWAYRLAGEPPPTPLTAPLHCDEEGGGGEAATEVGGGGDGGRRCCCWTESRSASVAPRWRRRQQRRARRGGAPVTTKQLRAPAEATPPSCRRLRRRLTEPPVQ